MERPILFSTPMVQAILDGRKTQTRRVVKINGWPITSPKESLELTKEGLIYHSFCSMSGYYKLLCQPGDVLWVRETWAKKDGHYFYKAGHELLLDGKPFIERWKPSIHMPREAARIFLRVTNVKVERLQNITEEDAKAEGIEPRFDVRDQFSGDIARQRFKELWDSINAKRGYGWVKNPWVWVIEFERVRI